jgi:hypothetical protein
MKNLTVLLAILFILQLLSLGCSTSYTNSASFTNSETLKTETIDLNGKRPVELESRLIYKSIRKVKPELLACYKEALKTSPNMKGEIIAKVNIVSFGVIENISLVSSELKNIETENCMLKKLKAIKVPPLKSYEEVTVNVPFLFDKKSK